MTDWLNVEDVRADQTNLRKNPCCPDCVYAWETTAAVRVIEALASLPEPECEECGFPFAHSMHALSSAHPFEAGMLHRLWSIARVICGKEES